MIWWEVLLYYITEDIYGYACDFVEVVDPSRPIITNQQVKSLERFIPLTDFHLAFLRCHIDVYPANHPDVDIALRKNTRG